MAVTNQFPDLVKKMTEKTQYKDVNTATLTYIAEQIQFCCTFSLQGSEWSVGLLMTIAS